jgi:2-amino-4-hydroxy-6-hydroxymethyldihydropteridine diphosphokinase
VPLATAYIALGSNLGDRLVQMQAALNRLAQQAVVVKQASPVYENRAVGMGEADPFLNAMARIETSLTPLDLLDLCLAVESQLGRRRSGQWAPRTIDLDIIAYDDLELTAERLKLPHPRIEARDFVLYPLRDIAPDLVIRGRRVAELAAQLPMDALTRSGVCLYPPQI